MCIKKVEQANEGKPVSGSSTARRTLKVHSKVRSQKKQSAGETISYILKLQVTSTKLQHTVILIMCLWHQLLIIVEEELMKIV